MNTIIINVIHFISRLLTIAIIVDVALSYFMSPYHSVRQAFDRFMNPLLNPIRKVVPALGGIDFSPVILIILIQVIEILLVSIL